MAEPSLTGMPLELLVHTIATYLPTRDLGALRLTNKYLETALFDTFAKEFFTKKQFMLSTFSLGVLISISKHTAFAPFLKHVIIGLDQYPASGPGGHHIFAGTAQYEAFRNGWADQFILMSTGRDRQMLAEAFRNLPNLETVGIRDYSAQGRARDKDLWRSYGATTVHRDTGFPLQGASSESSSKVFTMLLQVLADANKQIPVVEVILRKESTGLSDFAFGLPDTTQMSPVLNGLQQLLLTLSFGLHYQALNPRGHGQPSTNGYRIPYLLESFLLRTTALKHLRLNFQETRFRSSWIDSDAPQILEGLTPNMLPLLERLELGMCGITPDLMVQLVTGFASRLRHLGLWKFQFTYSFLPRWKDSDGRFNPWPRFLADLSKISTLNLDNLTLGCLSHSDNLKAVTCVEFASGKVSEGGAGDKVVYLPQMIDNLRVQWPMAPRHDQGDEDEEDNEVEFDEVTEDDDDEEDLIEVDEE